MSSPLPREDQIGGADNLLEAAFDTTSDAVIIADAGHRVRRLNRAAHVLTGWSAEEAYGRYWSEIVQFAHGDPRESAGLAPHEPPVAGAYRIALRSRDASIKRVVARFDSIKAEGARVADGTVITLRQHDSIAALQSALSRTQQRLEIGFERGQIGMWDWNAVTDTLHEYGAWVGRTEHTATGSVVSGECLMQHTHPDDVENVRAALFAHLRGEREYYEVEQRVRLVAGGYVRFLVRGQTVERDTQGRSARLIGTYTDVTALREQEQLLQFALESSHQGIWEWDIGADRVIEHGYWRPRIDRYDLASPTDSTNFLRNVHPDDVPRLQAQLVSHLRGETAAVELEIRLQRTDGSYGYFLIRGRARERDHLGRTERLIGTYTEISDLKAQERRLQIALENGRQGLWEWEPDADRLHLSREWYAMLGYPEGSIRSHRDNVRRIVHPDDIATGYGDVMAMLKGERDDFQVEHRYRHRDGHYLHMLSRGRVLERNAEGRATRVIGTHVDITVLKDAQLRLIESRHFLATVIDTFPHRVFWKGTDSRYRGGNRVFAADVGVSSADAIIGKSDDDLSWHDVAEQLREDDRRILSGSEDKFTGERRITPVDGRPIWVETTKVPIRDASGAIVGVLGIYDDITQRRAREQQLQVVADALTSGQQSRVLNAVTRAAAELAAADYAYVARLNHDGTATVTACFPAQRPLQGYTYELAGTPCAITSAAARCYIPSGVRDRFPAGQLLREWAIEGYAGQQLATAAGEVIGLFTLLFTAPPPDESRVRTVIDIFASRATSELERERTHTETQASERRLNAAIEGGNQGVWEWDLTSDRLITFGQHFRDLGYPDGASHGTGSSLAQRIHADDRGGMQEALRAFFGGQVPTYEYEVRLMRADGQYHWTLIRGRASAHAPDGRVSTMIGTHTDISALKQVQSALERSQQFQELIIDTVPQAIFWQDRACRYLGCNQRFAELAGCAAPEDLIGKSDQDLWWAAQAVHFLRDDEPLLAGDIPYVRVEYPLTSRAGTTLWIELVKVPMCDEADAVIGILGALHDISIRKQAEEHAQRLSLYDPLTNLPNRRYFSERLEASLAAAARRGTNGALLFIDMDQFKRINDTLGHSVGDALLQAVAERLQNVTRQDDMVARLGGDEFVVLLPDLADDMEHAAHQASLVAEKIHESLGHPFQFEHHQFHVTPTIGISLFPEAGKGVDDVLKEADTAMYSGKAAGRNVTRFFRREMEESAQQRLRIENDLRTAIQRNELQLYFQPQVDRGRGVTGTEVLLRWRHPERGMIPPGEFIPVAEERGLIVEIGRWVLEAAFTAFKRWLDQGLVDVGELSINVSSRQFRANEFVHDVERLLAEYRIPAHRVVFELTEGTVIEDVTTTIEIMERLRRLGILFALDDFGVGYSSLSYLTRLPIDQLKIDRSFIAAIGSDHNDEIICQTIIAMGQHLGLQTVAEGVEFEHQFAFLRRLRCNRYQGYHFLPPSPEADFLRYCATSVNL